MSASQEFFVARHGVVADDSDSGYVTLADDLTLRGLVQIHADAWRAMGEPSEVTVTVAGCAATPVASQHGERSETDA